MSVLRRNEHDRFSVVTRAWEGQTVVLIGGGESLTVAQVEMVREAHAAGRVKVIGVNDAYLLAPWCDVLYFADAQWFDWHTAGVPRPTIKLSAKDVAARFASFPGVKCTIQSNYSRISDDRVHMLKNKSFPVHSLGLSLEPDRLVTGRNSGFQALNLAVLSGAPLDLLIGFDAREPGPTDRSHWFGDHPMIEPAAVYQSYRAAFSAAEHLITGAGVKVINCSPRTAIDTFEKMDLAEALCLQPAEA